MPRSSERLRAPTPTLAFLATARARVGAAIPGWPALIPTAIDLLIEERLLATDSVALKDPETGEESRVVTLEPAHEALLRQTSQRPVPGLARASRTTASPLGSTRLIAPIWRNAARGKSSIRRCNCRTISSVPATRIPICCTARA